MVDKDVENIEFCMLYYLFDVFVINDYNLYILDCKLQH